MCTMAGEFGRGTLPSLATGSRFNSRRKGSAGSCCFEHGSLRGEFDGNAAYAQVWRKETIFDRIEIAIIFLQILSSVPWRIYDLSFPFTMKLPFSNFFSFFSPFFFLSLFVFKDDSILNFARSRRFEKNFLLILFIVVFQFERINFKIKVKREIGRFFLILLIKLIKNSWW